MKGKKENSSTELNTELGIAEDENKDGMSFLMGVLCFFVPIVGGYQFVANIEEKPKRAKIGGFLGALGIISHSVAYNRYQKQQSIDSQNKAISDKEWEKQKKDLQNSLNKK